MIEYRASFDAAIRFSNGGDLVVHGFRVDVPTPDVGEEEIAGLFVASLGLLMTDTVEMDNVEIFAEPHKGTRGGPSDRSTSKTTEAGRLIELNQPTTRMHAPGADLSSVSLSATVDLPAVIVRLTGTSQRRVDVGSLAAIDVRGAAVLLHTGDDAAPALLTEAAVAWLVDHGAVLVGIDDVADGGWVTPLLAAGIPVVDQLTGLHLLPPTGARFTAVPPRTEGVAFARF